MAKYVITRTFFAGRLYEKGTEVQLDENFAKEVADYVDCVDKPAEPVQEKPKTVKTEKSTGGKKK